MLTIDIDFQKIQKAMAGLAASRKKEVWLRAMEGGLADVVEIAQNKYLSGPRPGKLGRVTNRLANSLESDHEESLTRVLEFHQDEAVGRVGTGVPYGKVHEFGTVGAGGTLPDIEPRPENPTGLLHFRGRDGRWVRTSKVAIPPRPFIQPAIQDAKVRIIKRFIVETERAMKEATEEA